MNKILTPCIAIIFCLFLANNTHAQGQNFWTSGAQQTPVQQRNASYKLTQRESYTLNLPALKKALLVAPSRKSLSAQEKSAPLLIFPIPGGKTETFRVYETPVMAPALAKRYPSIKSYTGVSTKNPSITLKFTITNFGFHGIILNPASQVSYINPESLADTSVYEVFSRSSLKIADTPFECLVNTLKDLTTPLVTAQKTSTVNDGTLRTFRLALACTGEYAQYHANAAGVGAGTNEQKRIATLAAMNVTLTRVNGIFERDLSLTMQLIPNNQNLIFLDPATDNLTNNDGGVLINEIQAVVDNQVGAANYDIGHVFSTGGGGIASLNSPCTSNKARGVTGQPSPMGDPFDVDFVAHEMGHQYGATHSFNNSCGGNRTNSTAVEPGSGTTIMTYAGICPPNILQNVEPYFHAVSIQQMWENITSGSSLCASSAATANTAPTASAGNNYTIPVGTPFVLEGQGADADGDTLTYCWEQTDAQVAVQPPSPNSSSGPLFRSMLPATSPNRFLPDADQILVGSLTPPWEVLPNVSREINFSLLVRDNHAGGGQTARDNMTVTVTQNAGPFMVTSQSTPQMWQAGEVHTVTWETANTQAAPIQADWVNILFYTDTSLENYVLLASNVANDGSHEIIVPGGIETTAGRVMVRPVDNIFFAINAANITVTQSEYVLYIEQLEQIVCQPNNLAFSFNYQPYLGFSDITNFTATGVPAGLTVAFNPPSAMNATQIDVTISNTIAVAEGDYIFTIEATSGTITKTYPVNVGIYDAVFENISLTAPADMSVTANLQPQLQWQPVDFTQEYQVDISQVADFMSLVETETVRETSYTPVSLQANTLYYWRVKPLNSCGEGAYSNTFSFTTSPIDCRTIANATPVLISSIETPIITSSIIVPDNLPLHHLSVSLNISHTWVEDLRATLTSPSGTVVNLFSNSCGDSDNINVTFDDTGSALTCNAFSPAISGVRQPEQPLSAFTGETIQGEWVLTVYDDADFDGGALTNFSIQFCANGLFPPDTDSDGVADSLDACPATPPGSVVDVTGCPLFSLPANNFTLQVTGESCIPNNDGSVHISAAQSLAYQAILTGVGINMVTPFTNEASFLNLPSGNYTLCITVNGQPGYVACYEAVITEPAPLAVQSIISSADKTVTLTLSGGTIYNITLNGVLTQTSQGQAILTLKNGINTLEVTTGKLCQGVYKDLLVFGKPIAVYPNPLSGETLNVLLPYPEEVSLSLYTLPGQLIYQHVFKDASLRATLPQLSAGVYLIKIDGETIHTTEKLIKL